MYCLSNPAVKWFHSYLSDRQQCVKVNGSTSCLIPINQGIPQGTIAGSMLFLIFINDAPLFMKSKLIRGKRLRKRMEKQHLAQNSSVDKLSINLNNSPIENVHSHKILGIKVDEDLHFTNHCEILARKISKRIRLLKHISPYLKRNQREIYYKQ